MPVKRQLIFLFDEYVERSVVLIPCVLELNISGDWGHVEEHLQPGRNAVLQKQFPLGRVVDLACSISAGVLETTCYCSSHAAGALVSVGMPVVPAARGATSTAVDAGSVETGSVF